MTVKSLPEQIDPFHFAEQGLHIEGSVALDKMPRLGENLMDRRGLASVKLHFGKDAQHVAYLKGYVESLLPLQCQRCMSAYDYAVHSHFTLGIVGTIEETDTLAEPYEPVLTQKGMLDLWDVVEDELILNLPLIPKHPPEACGVPVVEINLPTTQEKMKNPFNILETLKESDES